MKENIDTSLMSDPPKKEAFPQPGEVYLRFIKSKPGTRLVMSSEGYAKIIAKLDEIELMATRGVSDTDYAVREIRKMRAELFGFRNLLQTELVIDKTGPEAA